MKSGDVQLVQIIDAALADATRRSGEWLACRPGCTQCCIGAFAINQLDAARLQQGLTDLQRSEPARAAAVLHRAMDAVERLSADYPGDVGTGILAEGDEAAERFDEFANDEPCPALDPATGLCDLYAARPMTCRVFGPPVRSATSDSDDEGGLGVCELCFIGASDEIIAACEMEVDPDGLEATLLAEQEQQSGVRGNTIVAFALAKAVKPQA